MTMDERIITFFRGTSPKLRNLIACGVCLLLWCVGSGYTRIHHWGGAKYIYIIYIYIYVVGWEESLCVWAMRVFLGLPVDGRTELS